MPYAALPNSMSSVLYAGIANYLRGVCILASPDTSSFQRHLSEIDLPTHSELHLPYGFECTHISSFHANLGTTVHILLTEQSSHQSYLQYQHT